MKAPWCSRPRMRGFGRSWIGIARRAALSASTSGSASRDAHHLKGKGRHRLGPTTDATRWDACPRRWNARAPAGRSSRSKVYERELFRLQEELVKMEQWVADTRRPGRGDLRGARRGRQGRRDQAHHRAHEPAHHPHRRAAQALGPASARSGTSSGTSRSCRRRARSCCSTAAGTTAPASRRCSGSARRRSTTASCGSARSSSGCSSRTASC